MKKHKITIDGYDCYYWYELENRRIDRWKVIAEANVNGQTARLTMEISGKMMREMEEFTRSQIEFEFQKFLNGINLDNYWKKGLAEIFFQLPEDK